MNHGALYPRLGSHLLRRSHSEGRGGGGVIPLNVTPSSSSSSTATCMRRFRGMSPVLHTPYPAQTGWSCSSAPFPSHRRSASASSSHSHYFSSYTSPSSLANCINSRYVPSSPLSSSFHHQATDGMASSSSLLYVQRHLQVQNDRNATGTRTLDLGDAPFLGNGRTSSPSPYGVMWRRGNDYANEDKASLRREHIRLHNERTAAARLRSAPLESKSEGGIGGVWDGLYLKQQQDNKKGETTTRTTVGKETVGGDGTSITAAKTANALFALKSSPPLINFIGEKNNARTCTQCAPSSSSASASYGYSIPSYVGPKEVPSVHIPKMKVGRGLYLSKL